jgi:hypothetical protein
MKKRWKNPINRPAKQSTLETPGDFAQFTEIMKKVIKVRPPKEAKQPTASASPDPAAS